MFQALDYQLPEHLKARRMAHQRDRGIQVGTLLLACLSLAAAGLLLGPINQIRKDRQLLVDPEQVKDLPTDIALLGKLGTFRALAIDWAAIRAERLKEEGKTYEALQLHQTVCSLAPRFPAVWIYAAWNMAYNISVIKYTPEERWHWVKNGIEHIRDKGLVYNPKAVSLYKELAYIYWHKIGDFLDDEHLNYKRALAVEIQRVLGPPPITLTDKEYFDWFRPIANAPPDPAPLAEIDPVVDAVADRLRSLDLTLDISLLEFVAKSDVSDLQASDLVFGEKGDITAAQQFLDQMAENEAFAEAFERLVASVRHKVLKETYKLDPKRMMHLMEDRYGPLDWRNAFSHTLYWADLGDEIGRNRAANTRNEQITNARFVFYSLEKLITAGTMVLYPDYDDPFLSYIDLSPDLRFIPYLFDEYMRLGEEHFKDDPRYVEPPGPIYKTGLVSSMHNWIELYYLEGGEENRAQAEKYYAWLREHNPHPDGSTQERYLQTLDEFVMGNILEQLSTYKAAGAFIKSFISKGLKHWSLGQDQQALNALSRARKSYEYWMADTRNDINDRRKMQSFRILFRDATEQFLTRRDIHPLFKVRLWKRLPFEQQQYVYDRLSDYFARICKAQDPSWDVALAFPEPPGMEAFRQTEIEYRGEPRRDDVEPGERYKP